MIDMQPRRGLAFVQADKKPNESAQPFKLVGANDAQLYKVVAIGSDFDSVKLGDRVLLKNRTAQFTMDGVEYIAVEEDDIMGFKYV